LKNLIRIISQQPKTMVFMASRGHFSAGFLGSGADFIAFHPDIIDKTVAVLTIEHLGCKDYQDIQRGANLVYEPTGKLTQGWAYGPSGQAAQIIENALPGSLDRLAVLSLSPPAQQQHTALSKQLGLRKDR
jgi:hypothetical protein